MPPRTLVIMPILHSLLPIISGLFTFAPPVTPPVPPVYTAPSLGDWPTDRITPLLRAVDPEKLRAWHVLLASEPHIAGSSGDLRQADRITKAFTDMGLEVERHEFFAYLATPVSARLDLIELATNADGTDKTTPLITKENILTEDADSANPDLTSGWNAYSGSGDITAELVYANRGTKADFDKLRELKVDLTGKIVLCRYGGNFRGYKVKFAQAAGAAAVIICTDPGKDADPLRAYPAGPYQNDSCIERGSINTLGYPGDPLTPGIAATQDAKRLDPSTIDLPKIPVQPIGWGAARTIFTAIAAHSPPPNDAAPLAALPDGWQGGLNVPYQIIGGPNVKLRVKVEQKREITRSFNIIGTLTGSEFPDQWVLIGSHHDAWGFGACDPASGTICTLEAARIFSDAAKRTKAPRRTMKFCCWGAEEFSIIGSTEWVESRADEVRSKAVAYINLDMAAMGPDFGCSSASSLKALITEAARHVPAINSRLTDAGIEGQTVLEAWLARKDAADPLIPGAPKIGALGGGSDHVAFWCHTGVPSCGMSASGTKGSAYHSVYDTLNWYRTNVGNDYQSPRMVTQMTIATAAMLAMEEVPALDFSREMHDVALRLEELALLADSKLPTIAAPIRELAVRARNASTGMGVWSRPVIRSSALDRSLERQWQTIRERTLTEAGLPLREWFRNELASPDADSGYEAWVLPRLTRAIERADLIPARIAIDRYGDMIGGGGITAQREPTLRKSKANSGLPMRPRKDQPNTSPAKPTPSTKPAER